MRRILLLGFVILAFAGLPSASFAEGSNGLTGKATPESTGATQTGAQGEIQNAQKQLPGIKGETPKASDDLQKAGEACKKALDEGKNACAESLSPIIKQMMSMVPQLIQQVMSATGKDKCNAMAKGLGALNGLQGDYGKSCEEAKNKCTQTCSDSSSKASQANTNCVQEANQKYPMSPAQASAAATKCQQAAAQNQGAISKGVDACNALKANSDAGKANQDALQQGGDNSSQCEADEAVDCKKPENKDNPSCPKVIDCNAPGAIDQYPQCKCQVSPNLCNGKTNLVNNPTVPNDSPADSSGDGNLGSGAPAADAVEGGNHPAASGGGLPGAFGDSGGGGLKGGGTDNGKTAKDKPTKTDIFGGDGGGGGGRGSGGNSDPYDKGPNSALAKQIEKNAAAAALAKQFTGSFGKSNWEKVNAISQEKGHELIVPRK